MPSQEEYLDNLLKGIETENMETEVTKEPKMTGTEEETAKAPETPEPVEEIVFEPTGRILRSCKARSNCICTS